MDKDFTLDKYKSLLLALQTNGISFSLRHDVDKNPLQSLRVARLEASMGIHSVFYFRIVPASNDPAIIQQIVDLGHEIGYHYEDLSLADGDCEQAITMFADHLAYFRRFYPVHRICMHGAPMSNFDGRDLWRKTDSVTRGKCWDYHDFGVDYEPYFDEDYTQTLYLTDTGRRWDGWRVSVRDKVKEQERWVAQGLVFHSTNDIIHWLQTPAASQQVSHLLITTHPQRWLNECLPWTKELMLQNSKNLIKRVLIWLRGC